MNKSPNDTSILNYKGNALKDIGNYNDAITFYNKALAVDPNYNFILINKGNTLIILGKNEEAINSFDKVLAREPNNPVALMFKYLYSR